MHRILRITCIHTPKQSRLEIEFMIYNLIRRKDNLSIGEALILQKHADFRFSQAC